MNTSPAKHVAVPTKRMLLPKKRVWLPVIVGIAIIGITHHKNLTTTGYIIAIVCVGIILHYYFQYRSAKHENKIRQNHLLTERVVLLETLEFTLEQIEGADNQLEILDKYFKFITHPGQCPRITNEYLKKMGPKTRNILKTYLQGEICNDEQVLTDSSIEYKKSRTKHLFRILVELDLIILKG